MTVDLNCDMGESYGRYRLGDDAALLNIVTSANIACGFHAGDPQVMASTVNQAASKGVAIGAHPGYPDLQGFGRRAMALTPQELHAAVLYQIGALAAFTSVAGKRISHVKPHGALYNTAAHTPEVAEVIVDAVKSFDASLVIVTLPHSKLYRAAREAGLRVAVEGFADRAYQVDGSLVPRTQSGAVIHDPNLIADRALKMVRDHYIQAITNEPIPVRIDTLCIHGDTDGAARIAQRIRDVLESAGILLSSFTEQ